MPKIDLNRFLCQFDRTSVHPRPRVSVSPYLRVAYLPRSLFKLVLVPIAVVGTVLSANKAVQACSDLPNICEQQRLQHEQNIENARQQQELWQQQQQQELEEQNSGYGNYSSPPQRAYDPMESRVNLVYSLFKLYAIEQQKLLEDLKYQKYINGSWDFFQDSQNPKPGEYCVALFQRKGTILTLSGPGGEYKGALLSFWGQDIPRPQKVETVKVTLTQSNETPQTVTALNYSVPGSEFGTVSLVVPTIEAALAGIEEVQSFDVSMGGKSVAKIEWHSGLTARDNLRKCLSAKART